MLPPPAAAAGTAAAAHSPAAQPTSLCFRSRQQLEMEYYDEFSESVALQEEKRGPMTALTLLAAVPRLLRFYIVRGLLSLAAAWLPCPFALRWLPLSGTCLCCRYNCLGEVPARAQSPLASSLSPLPPSLSVLQIPAPIRFVVYLAWVLVEEVKYWLRKQAVLIGEQPCCRKHAVSGLRLLQMRTQL